MPIFERCYAAIGPLFLKAEPHGAGDQIRIWYMTNCHIFIKNNSYCYQFNFGTCQEGDHDV